MISNFVFYDDDGFFHCLDERVTIPGISLIELMIFCRKITIGDVFD